MTKLLLIVFIFWGNVSFAQHSSTDSCLILFVDSLKKRGEIINIIGGKPAYILINRNVPSTQILAVIFKKRTKEERKLIIQKQIEERKKQHFFPKRFGKFVDRSWYDIIQLSTKKTKSQSSLIISTLEKGQYILEIDPGIKKSPRKNIVMELIVQ